MVNDRGSALSFRARAARIQLPCHCPGGAAGQIVTRLSAPMSVRSAAGSRRAADGGAGAGSTAAPPASRPIRPSPRTRPSSTTASCANSRCTSIPIYRTTPALLHQPLEGEPPGRTTPTDTRSQRSRTSRRGGHLLHGLAAHCARTACPYVFPGMPLFRTVAPYARPQRPGQQNSTRASKAFHTSFLLHRVVLRSAPAGGQRPR
jgi:hypothetical protein